MQLLGRKTCPAHHYADESFQVTDTLKRVFLEEQHVGPFSNVNRPELTGLAQKDGWRHVAARIASYGVRPLSVSNSSSRWRRRLGPFRTRG
jgi:hypothetical protein